MNAQALKGAQAESSKPGWSDRYPYLGGGFVLGVVTIGLCLAIDLTVLLILQQSTGSGTGAGVAWPQWAVAAFGLFALVVSISMGRWLFRLRRWVGTKDDPESHQTIVSKRRSFTGGAMLSYVPLSPVVCVLMIAMANST